MKKRHAKVFFITSLYENGELIHNNTGIEWKIFDFYSNLYHEKCNLLPNCIDNLLQSIWSTKIKRAGNKKSWTASLRKEIPICLAEYAKWKVPGNDGLTKEFYETFWDDIKRHLTLSFQQAFKKGELSTSQKQAVIKLIKKKG